LLIISSIIVALTAIKACNGSEKGLDEPMPPHY